MSCKVQSSIWCVNSAILYYVLSFCETFVLVICEPITKTIITVDFIPVFAFWTSMVYKHVWNMTSVLETYYDIPNAEFLSKLAQNAFQNAVWCKEYFSKSGAWNLEK